MNECFNECFNGWFYIDLKRYGHYGVRASKTIILKLTHMIQNTI